MTIKPINPELKPVLEKFLTDPYFQDSIKAQSKILGYNGDSGEKVRVSLFAPDDDKNICFANDAVHQLFIDFQILEQLRNTEPYTTLLKHSPEKSIELIALSKQLMIDDEHVDKQAIAVEIMELFPKDIWAIPVEEKK